MFRIFWIMIAGFLLSGCSSVYVMSHVPLSTMSRLSTMTLADIDPAQLRVAARMPEQLEPRKDGFKVTLTLGANTASKMTFVLEPSTEPPDLAGLTRFQQTHSRLWIYRLSTSDVALLQRTIAVANGGETNVSIAAGVDACRRGPLTSAPLPTTTLLRVGADGFFVLADDLDLREIVPERDLATKVLPCA